MNVELAHGRLERTSTFGQIPGLAGTFPARQTLEIFTQTCFNRHFEFESKKVHDRGLMKLPIYLSVGQEHIPAAIASVFPDCLIFAQHRAHSVYLSFGGDPVQLIDELLHRPTGCAGGMGGSASIHSPQIGMFGHSGLMGDAAAEEDYIYGALGFAITKKLPVLFVCEDNDLSILTRTAVRRSWTLCGLAQGLGLPAVDITDDPWLIAHHVRTLAAQLPALINIRTCRGLWHAGTGCDGPPEWDRFALIKETLSELGLGTEAAAIESESERTVQNLWAEQLRKL